MELSKEDLTRLRVAMLELVERYTQAYHVTQADAYEVCERAAVRVFGTRLYPSYNAYRIALTRSNENGAAHEKQLQEMVEEWECFIFETHFDQIRGDFANYEQSSGDICRGTSLTIKVRDADGRINPRLDEHDELEREETDSFLRRVCDILNALPRSHRHWTIEDIRAEVARARRRNEQKTPGGNPNSPERT